AAAEALPTAGSQAPVPPSSLTKPRACARSGSASVGRPARQSQSPSVSWAAASSRRWNGESGSRRASSARSASAWRGSASARARAARLRVHGRRRGGGGGRREGGGGGGVGPLGEGRRGGGQPPGPPLQLTPDAAAEPPDGLGLRRGQRFRRPQGLVGFVQVP